MRLNDIDFGAQLAGMKDIDYRNTLAISTLIELLTAKGVFTRAEFAAKAAELETASLADIIASRRRASAVPPETLSRR